jgi:6-pyruvoyltetrahydropterin/6-carboxytetrahydropterin synthase
MYKISKVFDFCYGHRVWNQTLDSELSCNSPCKCKNMHGHNGIIKIGLVGEELYRDMVTDFNNLSWFKKFIDDNLDHKFIMDINDPLGNFLFSPSLGENWKEFIVMNSGEKYLRGLSVFELSGEREGVSKETIEILNGFVFVDFVPTSENFSKWFFDMVSLKMKEHFVYVAYVEFKESTKTSSEYYNSEGIL